MFFAGLGNGLGAGITIGEPQTIWRLTLAGLAFVPAMAVDGRRRRLGRRAAACLDRLAGSDIRRHSLYLGALLRLPQWLTRRCHRSARPRRPTDYSVVALTVMAVVAAALTLCRGRIYRRRDAV